MQLEEALKLFLRDHDVSVHTAAGYKAAIDMLGGAGMKKVEDVTRPRFAAWVDSRLERGIRPTTIRVQIGGICSVLGHLERLGKFPLAKLLSLRRCRPRLGRMTTSPRFLSVEELTRLRLAARSVRDELELAICLAVFAGLRLNELRCLLREDLRLEAPQPYVDLRRGIKGGRPRTVPIARAFAQDLRERWIPEAGPVFPPYRLSERSRDPFLSRNSLQHGLVEAREICGLHDVTWFTLRHTYASWLRSAGVSMSKISGWMGNTVAICERHYAALAPGGDDDVERGFERAPSAERLDGVA